MSAQICKTVSCCEPAIWPIYPPGIVPQLSGLIWEMPCTGHVNWPPPFSCDCVEPADQVTTLTGNDGFPFTARLLFRGVIEVAQYGGGEVISGTGGMFLKGGTAVPDGHNVYTLIVSDPAQTYYLNRWDGVIGYNPVYGVRYIVEIPITGGATITLHTDAINSIPPDPTKLGQVMNSTNALAPSELGDPPLGVTQPYDAGGQFMQMDALAVF
jgi:hypothetical protein